MEPIRLNTRIADRRFLLSLSLSVLLNAALAAVLVQPGPGLRRQVFFLLAETETRLRASIGSPLSVLPAQPRFAAAAVVGEDRYDPGLPIREPSRSARARAMNAAAAPVEPDSVGFRPAPDADAGGMVRRAGAVWERESPLDDPAVRISPGSGGDFPVRGVRLPAPAVAEGRFAPAGYEPARERSRAGELDMSPPSGIADGDHRPDPGDAEVEFIRAAPIRARPAVLKSPGVYAPLDALEPDGAALAGKKNLVWLVEEKRFDPAAGAGDLRPASRRDGLDAHAPLLFTTPEASNDPSATGLPSGSLSRRPSFRDLMRPEPPGPEPVPGPESPDAPDDADESPETSAGPPDRPADRDPVLPVGSPPVIAGGFAVIYPPRSLRHGESGVVVIEATIDAAGRVRGARIADSSGFPALDEAALDAVRGARFGRDGVTDGVGTRVERHVIVFKLN